jgi:hypothetical protein
VRRFSGANWVVRHAAERGLVSADEIARGYPLGESKKVDGILRHDPVEGGGTLSRRPDRTPASVPARFRIGDASGQIRSSDDADTAPAPRAGSPRYH